MRSAGNSRVRLIHWKADEAAALLANLRIAGHTVDYDEKLSSGQFRAIRETPPDAFVIDLSRLPSHGREVATFLRGQKVTRHIPIVFVGGPPEKVAAIRKLLPDAVYTAPERLQSALRTALANRPTSPVVPPQMMARYASRSAAQKLGIREGSTAALIDPPRNYVSVIGELPARATLEEMPREAAAATCPLALWFVRDIAELQAGLPGLRKLAARTKLWILWRKGSNVTQPFLRESTAAVGLVDYKICSVDAVWSGMLFARRSGAPRSGSHLSKSTKAS
jgi:DNA-binding NarL/FixJ family response regulator